MKYIIFEDEKTGLLQPVIFGEHTTHACVTIEGTKPIRAGFVSIGKNGVVIHGESDSLNLKPDHSRDKRLIEFVIMGMGTMFFIPPILE